MIQHLIIYENIRKSYAGFGINIIIYYWVDAKIIEKLKPKELK